jgi:hypothetical protein
MTRRPAAFFGLSVFLAGLPLYAADVPERKGLKQSFEVTTTEHFNFLPGGVIRLQNSYGYLTVEGWDEPEVQLTVTKSTDRFYEPRRKQSAEQLFDQVRVAADRPSDHELVILTTLPVRNSVLTSVLPSGQIVLTRPLPPNNKRGVTVEYKVLVPRDSRLVVHQDNGYVCVSDVRGDLDVDCHTGDMIVMLTDPGRYSIDAITRLGSISSDLSGRGHKSFLVGTHFTYPSEAPAGHIHLRMGRGSITIKSGPPSGPYWKN